MSDVVIRIDQASPVPVYRQILDAIRTLIVEKKLNTGDRLPTVRELAINLCLNHNTVAQAYRELAAEGWLELGRRRGATVLPREIPKSSQLKRNLFTQRIREIVAKAQADGLTQSEIKSVLDDLFDGDGAQS